MKISIITLTYNSERNIISNINSVFNQTYDSIEHIIIDGASRDNTINLIKNSKFKGVLISENDNGLYDALNKGIRIATGDIIGILHSDDIFYSNDTISSIASFFKLDENLDFIFGNLLYKDKNLIRTIRVWKSKFSLLEHGWMPPHPTMFIKKTTYLDIGYYDISYKISADYNFIISLFKQNSYKFKYIDMFITIMRTGGVSNTKIYLKLKEDFLVLKDHKFRFPLIIVFLKNFRKINQYFYKNNI